MTLRALPLLAAILLTTAMPATHADEPKPEAAPLQELIRAGNAKSVRFVLTNGETIVGRIVRVDEDGLLIRRPSAGLHSLPLTDIAKVKIKAPDGAFLVGGVVRMADGGVGWLADGEAAPNSSVAGLETNRGTDKGGPLIRVDPNDDRGDTSSDDNDTEAIAVNLTGIEANDGPASESAPVRLIVTSETTTESDKLIYFRLRLSEPSDTSILIIYTMIDGSATAPGDYTHRQGVVVFEPGETQAVVATSLVNDEVAEGEENFIFFVTADPTVVTIAERKVDARIADDDG